MTCPNTSSPQWKALVAKIGVYEAFKEYRINNFEIPNADNYKDSFRGVNATLKIVDALLKSPREKYPSNQIQGFYNDLTKYGAPKDQIELLKEHIAKNNITDIDKTSLITSLLSELSYTVEINTGMKRLGNLDMYGGGSYFTIGTTDYQFDNKNGFRKREEGKEEITITEKEFREAEGQARSTPSDNYSNMTVPGGTNYREIEIATPAITPSIKGHASFSTDKGIGWFRSDDKVDNANIKLGRNIEDEFDEEGNNVGRPPLSQSFSQSGGQSTKTRRILEIQSDLFQKGRNNEQLLKGKEVRFPFTFEGHTYTEEPNEYLGLYFKDGKPIEEDEFHETAKRWQISNSDQSQNKFLQLLNKDNNWVNFFVKSIIQDSAKKGYEKVLFPNGNTAARVEGHGDLETFIRERQRLIDQRKDYLKEIDTKYFTTSNGKYLINGEIVDKDIFEEQRKEVENRVEREVEQFEKEIGQAKDGTLQISSIAKFYETTIKNVLDKRGYKPESITDEHGNGWYQVNIDPNRDEDTIYFQKPGIEQSKASQKTISRVKEWLSRNNIELQQLDTKRWGGVNAVANLLQNTIAIAEGKEDVSLPEETMHFAVDMLKQSNPALYKQMFNKIGSFNIYQSVKETYASDPQYKNEDGSLNIPKLKEEAIGKLLAEYYIKSEEGQNEKPELLIQTKSWIQQIIDWVKGLIGKADFNPFEEAIKQFETLSPETDEKIKEVGELITTKYIPGIFGQTVKNLEKEKDYRGIVALFAQQLEDPGTYSTAVDSYLEGDDELAKEILSLNQQFSQIAPEDEAQKLFNKFQEKIDTYKVEKVSDKGDDDEDINYYKAVVGGKVVRPDRTTEFAKRQNLKNTGGKDYLQNATEEQQAQWQKKAMSGTNGHYDIENIINASINDDGSIKDRKDIQLSFKPLLNQGVYKTLVKFLLGDDATTGFLYTFPEGTKFRTEQILYNEKAGDTGRASTIDLLAVLPDGSVKVYDWKFMGFDLRTNTDYPRFKRLQHTIQLTDYKNALKNAYGVKNVEAFTIPIHATYLNYEDPETQEKIPLLQSVQIGKANFKDESRTYLLPVVPENQSTGNPKIDSLVKALKSKYNRLYKKPTKEGEQDLKWENLNDLSIPIRNLQVAQNFKPLAAEAISFQASVNQIIDKYKDIDFSTLSPEQLDQSLSEVMDMFNSSDYYSNIDEAFVSQYGDDNLSQASKDTLDSLRKSSSTAKNKKDEILAILQKAATFIASREGFNNYFTPEKEIKGIINTVLESGDLPNKSLNLFTKMLITARSEDKVVINQKIEEFGHLYEALTTLSKSTGKDAFDLIASKDSHELIKKTSPEFWTALKKAKENKDKTFFIKNIDKTAYDKLAEERVKEITAKIEARTYDTEPRIDAAKKKAKILELKQSLLIGRVDFNGFNDRTFSYLLGRTINEEPHYTEQYKNLLKPENKAALDMYNYIFNLNTEAKQTGYLKREKSKLFLPFIHGTTLQRILQSNNKFSTLRDAIKDSVTVQADEKQSFAKIDEETGEQDRNIPVFFTTNDKNKTDYSTDLLRIIPLYIQALVEFNTSKELENTFLTLHKVEENKGHLETDKNNNVLFENDVPKVFEGNRKNADLLKKSIDDAIYGIKQDTDTLIDRGVNKLSKGTEEEKEKKALSTKKLIQQTNKWTQQLAVGMKALVAIPNYIGAHLQATINAGRYYKGREYPKAHAKIVASSFTGREGNVEKALIDLVIPLNEDVVKHKRRELAYKQSALKWLSTWSFQDVMMSTNQIPDKAHQLTNALIWMENTMVQDGKLVNIRQYLRNQPEYKSRYANPSSLKETEKAFEARVKELKETQALPKTAKFNEEGHLTIPGFDINNSNLGEYRAKIVEYGRYITGQMSLENKADYRRNILATSFMMFKNWIVKQVSVRALDIHKNPNLDEWEYGRTRLFFKTLTHLGFKNITQMRGIITGTPQGLQHMREILEAKKEEYYKKTGQILDITEEEFFDTMRKELQSQAKELALLLGILAIVFTSKAALPPDDDDDPGSKNRYKFLAKAISKASDELLFYYNPLSTESITRGTILPSLGILSKASTLLVAASKQAYGFATDNDELQESSHPTKYFLDMLPIASQFQTEILPIIDPETAKELGVKTSSQARPMR